MPFEQVAVVDAAGQFLGNFQLNQAQQMAQDQGLDCIKVGRQKDKDVYKIIDHGKWLYEQKKAKKASKSHSNNFKEMKFNVRIDPHDLSTKISRIEKFIDKGLNVRLVVDMRGRERSHPELAQEKMDEIVNYFGDRIKVDAFKRTKSSISTMIHPSKGKHPQDGQNHEETNRVA